MLATDRLGGLLTRSNNPWRFIKNAAANLARGGVGAVVAILLPALLVRHMSEESYGIWSLILQVAAYIGYLDFGLQTAIGRYVAFANEKNDNALRDSVVSTAFAGLCAASIVGILCLSGVALFADHLFPRVPAEMLPSMRWTLLIVGVSMACGLPASAWNGVFVGLQRYEIPALTIGGAKLLSAVAVALVAIHEKSLKRMAIAMAAVNLISYAVQYCFFRLLASEIRISWTLICRSTVRELGSYCLGLTVWSFAMLLVNGLDLLLVGRFDFLSLGSYAVASSLVTFVAGSQGAIFSAMMPHAAATHAQGSGDKLGKLVLTSTRIGTMVLLLCGLTLFLYSTPILRVWVGSHYAVQAHGLMSILLFANMIRMVWVPYSIVLLGTGQQKLLTIAPLLEGFTNLLLSVVLGLRYGAAGVAWGTMAGSIVGSLVNLLYTLGRSRDQVRFEVRQFLFEGLAVPGFVAIPFLPLLTFQSSPPWPATLGAFSVSIVIGVLIEKRPRLHPMPAPLASSE